MALPKFNELSSAVQVFIILLVGVALYAGTEMMFLKPVADMNAKKRDEAAKLATELAPLREYERKQKVLMAENEQLELKLATLRQIVPEDKDVDSFIRLVAGASNVSGIDVRRFTSKPTQAQDYYVEVPFEVEIDGPYYDLMGFFDRLGKMERIVNVTDLKMDGLSGGKGGKGYVYAPNESVMALCKISTFFSSEEQQAPTKPLKTAAKTPPNKAVQKKK